MIRTLGPLSLYATYAAESKNGDFKAFLKDHCYQPNPLLSLQGYLESFENRDVLRGESFEARTVQGEVIEVCEKRKAFILFGAASS